MVDLDSYLSHPDKSLLVHTKNVQELIRDTTLKIARFAAIFHDIGKLNPNFQAKLKGEKNTGYSNHSYLSAYIFLCYCSANHQEVLKEFNNKPKWLGSILAIIAHHHGDLPDFPFILNESEYFRLLNFLEQDTIIPALDFLRQILSSKEFLLNDNPLKEKFFHTTQIGLVGGIDGDSPFNYFLETRFAFASLILADKVDASGYQFKEIPKKFSEQYLDDLNLFCKKLPKTSNINKTRTKMRKEAVLNLKTELKNGKRIFSLIAPTGSGKTLILLSLAGEVLKTNKNMRIIYALPFLAITEQVENICLDIFTDLREHIRRIDSKSEDMNFEKMQARLDNDPAVIK
ncbi:MAG: CRISPR-associated endonuclease Cas3'', partial [Proteobacteria bacterium]|nr:CRISPR-associated endonuclease Cas3'' [Pseudomonadota bacterium]